MHRDVSVRAIARAQAATDAPVLDDDLERVPPPNRSDRTPDHAQRIAALAARRRNQVFVEPQTLADKTRHAVVRIGARVDTFIAARALLEIEDEQALRLHQTLSQEIIQLGRIRRLLSRAVLREPLLRNALELCANRREGTDHLAEVLARNADCFDMVERAARSRAHAAAEQADLAEVAASRDVREHEIAAGMHFAHLHEAEPHQVERIGRIALAHDDLAWRVANQLDARTEIVDEVGRQPGKHRNTLQMILERATPVGIVEPRTERLVLLQNIEHVPQHLERRAVGRRAHRGGARMETHARHLAEQITRAEPRDRVVVRQIDRRVDRNPALAGFFRPYMLVAVCKHAADLAEPSARRALLAHMLNRRRDKDIDRTFGDVIRSRTELPFAANDVAGLVVT